jgi:GH25 family lysozyme M1 (1,4-beta-N-acetylmuramidase)
VPTLPRRALRRLAVVAVAATLTAAGVHGTSAVAHAVGIDVSKWQHNPSVDWAEARNDGVTFAFIKATEGSFYTNPHYAADRAAARSVGIFRGAYHFARPSSGSAVRQARYFVARAGEHDGFGDLPPVLDLEDSGGLGTQDLRAWTRSWLEAVESLTGRTPVIYASPSFWEDYLGDSRGFRGYPLWVAHYETTEPQVPGGWTDWTFWQKANTGRVDGIIGAVDINRFNGTRAELAALAQAAPAEDVASAGSDREVPAREDTAPGPADAGGPDPTDPGAPDPRTGSASGSASDSASDSPSDSASVRGTGASANPRPVPDATATTRVSLHLSTEAVYQGRRVSFAGALRGVDGEALPGRSLTLDRRVAGSSAWTRVAAPTTGGTGRYSFSLTATRPGSFRVRYPGEPGHSAALSPSRSLAVRPQVRTRATLSVERTAPAGESITLSGQLRTADGAPLPARTISVYRLVNGSTAWELVTHTNTVTPTGAYQVLVRPAGIETYRAVFDGSTAHTRAESNLATAQSG